MYLKCNVILHLMNEMDHLRCQDVTVMQHPREFCKRVKDQCYTPQGNTRKTNTMFLSFISALYLSKKKKKKVLVA